MVANFTLLLQIIHIEYKKFVNNYIGLSITYNFQVIEFSP